MAKKTGLIIPAERIQQCIFLIRKQKVMLDKDLAALYGVTTKRLNEQVQRNIGRFPSDFMFQLNNAETKVLRSQIATSKIGRGGRRYNPYAFTEQGKPKQPFGFHSKKSKIKQRNDGKEFGIQDKKSRQLLIHKERSLCLPFCTDCIIIIGHEERMICRPK